jgi:hypothetical protein
MVMYWDWGNVALAFSAFAGLAMMALNFGFGETHSRPPESAQEHRWYEVMELLTELARKAAITERTEKQLLMVRETIEMMNHTKASPLKERDYEKETANHVSANRKN